MKVVPLHNKVLIRPKAIKEVSDGGIIIPDSAKDKPSEGEVIAVGPGVYNAQGDLIPVSVQEGDVIIYQKYNGTPVEVDDEELLILHESEILVKLVK